MFLRPIRKNRVITRMDENVLHRPKTIRKHTTASKTEAKHESEHVLLSFILRILKLLPLFYNLLYLENYLIAINSPIQQHKLYFVVFELMYTLLR